MAEEKEQGPLLDLIDKFIDKESNLDLNLEDVGGRMFGRSVHLFGKVNTRLVTLRKIRKERLKPEEVMPTPLPPSMPVSVVKVPIEVTEIRGIGPKRAEELKEMGIQTVGYLAKASAEKLAADLKISPKITEKWIEQAKKLLETAS